MKEFKQVIMDPIGLHARPAGLLVKQAAAFNSKITLSCNGKSADAKKLLAIMGLGIKQGMEVTCQIEGNDEAAAFSSIQQFFKDNL